MSKAKLLQHSEQDIDKDATFEMTMAQIVLVATTHAMLFFSSTLYSPHLIIIRSIIFMNCTSTS